MKTGSSPAYIRYSIRRDLPEMLAIEEDSFNAPWTEDDFVKHMRTRNVIGMVAEVDQRVVGYIVYALNKSHLLILNIAVAAEFRRRGIGRQMIEKLAAKLRPTGRKSLRLHVMEPNVAAQVFFRSCGFLAVGIEDEWFETGETAYEMRRELSEASLT